MSYPVFISYARRASATEAQALASALGARAFFDTSAIEDGDQFPEHLLDGILDASIVVIFATKAYTDSQFCRLEMRLALAGGDLAASHLVLALGERGDNVIEAMPVSVADQSWPSADATDRLQALVERRLAKGLSAIRQRLSGEEARRISMVFLEESHLPSPQSLHRIPCSFPPGIVGQSIGARFVGRADLLRNIHRVLSAGTAAGAAQVSLRISAGGGFGKTRLAIEYLYRYGQHYPGGIFWVNASSSTIEVEYWRVLSTLDPAVPELSVMRKEGRDVLRELARALRAIGQPALYVIDNIPEAVP